MRSEMSPERRKGARCARKATVSAFDEREDQQAAVVQRERRSGNEPSHWCGSSTTAR